MDIARIRKKLKEKKEADSKQVIAGSQKEKDHESPGVKPDKTAPDAEKKHETEAIETAGRSELAEEKTLTKKDEQLTIRVEKEIKIQKAETKKQEQKSKIAEERKDNIIEILTFSLLREEFAFRVSQIEEILRSQRITMVPKMPAYVLGVTSLRGKIIPVIDLKKRLSLKSGHSEENSKGKILIIKGPRGPIGIAIDMVTSVIRLSEAEILPPPSHLTENELKFIEGVAILDKRFISIIHMEEAIKIVMDNDKE
ncbi:MAG: chemotaxis protein CheW [Nitrospirota bacterium]|nr:chemotaxis protein CheW [Nitrospirota bacterium]MDH5768075.1 chemotaxis protein CheW [Nitrospirota bacterium]